ncbi:MAG: HIT family protein [Alphaproteobacteria bacterium]|nr:HIT family protein [Alphaproteobacteria bacterium]
MTGQDGNAAFELHPRLAADTEAVRGLGLSRLLLMNDRRFPWVILVPERAGTREIHHLGEADRAVLMEEIARVGAALQDLFTPDKINVGAIGNIVPQLHVHVVARRVGDAAWPGPVWGAGTAEPYAAGTLAETVRRIAAALD